MNATITRTGRILLMSNATASDRFSAGSHPESREYACREYSDGDIEYYNADFGKWCLLPESVDRSRIKWN